ncbi:uncharacterized protein LOC118183981 isoform X2 [Stegodyphus dumicola]|uniref:uncharacterized protein LOC118183981 isoform X2 n=1 Tax=Stegodyphus dumicola TaxID=202533 RepID=UPI0015AF34BE|nr:uncharacterized protein LOC118183981 isoform X2 [Stegodyphus dumicola]
MERKPKKRAARLTIKQKQLLLKFAEENPDFQRIKTDDNFTLEKKNKLWDRVTTLLNSDGLGAVKSPHEWRKTWNCWKSSVRTQYAKSHQCEKGPGGIMRMSAEDEELLGLVGVLGGNPGTEKMNYETDTDENYMEVRVLRNSGSLIPGKEPENSEEFIPEDSSSEESAFSIIPVSGQFQGHVENSQRRRREMELDRASRQFVECQKQQTEATLQLTEALRAHTQAMVKFTSVLEKLIDKMA